LAECEPRAAEWVTDERSSSSCPATQWSDRLRSLTVRHGMFLVHKTTFPIKYAMTTDDTVATIPGTIKLWFKTYFPIPVVPV